VTERVAVIGVGKIGGSMAGHLLKAGVLAAVYDPHPGRLAPFAEQGLACSTPAAAAQKASIVIVPLPTGWKDPVADPTEPPTSAYMEQILLGTEGVLKGARPGTLVVDMTTGDPNRTRRLAPAVAAAGCAFMDAPISGAEARAKDATLLIMPAGEPADYERLLPVLRHLGTEIRYMGPLGTGHTAKLLHNLLVVMNEAALCEATALAELAGIDRERFMTVVNAGVANSHMSRWKGPRIVARDYANSVDQITYQNGVLHLVAAIIASLRFDAPLARSTERYFQSAVAQGYSEADTACLVDVIAAQK